MSAAVERREAKSRAALVAAYREGLGLAALAVTDGPAGTRIVAVGDSSDRADASPGDPAVTPWWCRRAADAERVAAAATAQLRRIELRDDPAGPSAAKVGAKLHVKVCYSPGEISAVIARAAKRLCVVVYSDQDISADAQRIIARVEEEIENLRRAGQLKSVNRSYRTYRMEAAARGEKAAPYAVWFDKYKAKLVRDLAASLRYA